MYYRVKDNAPNALLRVRGYNNKGQAYLYAKNLKKHLPLGYRIIVEKHLGQGLGFETIAEINSIGNKKR